MPVSWGTSGSSRAQLRDAITGDALDDLNLPESGVSSEAIRPDGRIVATVMAYPANEIRLWDLARRGPPAVLAGHRNTVLWLKFSSDGRQLASYSMDRMMRIWDTATNKSVALPSGHVLGADPTFRPPGAK